MTARISSIGLGFAVRRVLVVLHTVECSPRWGCPALALRRRAVRVDASSCSIIAAPRLEVCMLYDLHQELVPFDQAWVQQVAVLEDTIKRIEAESPGHSGSVILLQHPPVFTLGPGSTTDHLRFDPEQPPYPLIRTERGGEVTYHGPGQLVLYPIMNLRHYKQDLHCYLRGLEEVIIRTLDSVSGIKAGRIEGLTGVWVNDAKVAAIGIRARRWVTYHGLAINVVTDLAPFQHIVPCGIADKAVTSIKELLQAQNPGPWGPAEDAALMEEYAHGLLEAFSEVFNVTLVDAQKSQQLLMSDGVLVGQ